MAKQSRDIYITQDPALNYILARIAARLDTIEGLLPDMSSGLVSLQSNKTLRTDVAGDMAWQNSTDVSITGGTAALSTVSVGSLSITNESLTYTDSNDTVIHQIGDTTP